MRQAAIILLLIFLCAFDNPRLVKIKLAEGITVLLPKNFQPMAEMDFTDRYPSVRAPIAAYTNEERVVDFSLNISATQWPDKNAGLAQKFFKSSIQNMFDRVEWINEGVTTIHGKEFIFFEFESRINGNPRADGSQPTITRYTYIQYLLQPKRALVFSFNCPVKIRPDWQETAHQIMASVKVK
jgi:hypothetical protein